MGLNAASTVLMNMLGLVCDPVSGRMAHHSMVKIHIHTKQEGVLMPDTNYIFQMSL
ncbi:MAG: hypothetical protein ACI4DR_09920 [Roseburia sp.]